MNTRNRVPTREERLEAEVRELRSELRRLTLRVDEQSDQLSELGDRVSEVSSVAARSVVEEESLEEVPVRDLVEERGESSTGGYSVVSAPAPLPTNSLTPTGSTELTWAFREEVARQIGGFLRRSLDGQHRGPSGREQLRQLASRVYLVVRDFEGNVFDRPVRLFNRFQPVKQLCYKKGTWGDSIFIGLPSQREAYLAVVSAGLGWPGHLN